MSRRAARSVWRPSSMAVSRVSGSGISFSARQPAWACAAGSRTRRTAAFGASRRDRRPPSRPSSRCCARVRGARSLVRCRRSGCRRPAGSRASASVRQGIAGTDPRAELRGRAWLLRPRTPDECPIPGAHARAHARSVETQTSPAEDLPALYRAILDGIADLERAGQHREAALIRTEATRVYSTSWDDAGRRRLLHLRRRIERVIAGDERPRDERTRWRDRARSLTAR